MTRPSNFADVHAFHVKYELEHPDLPRLLPSELQEFRAKFLQEELTEFIEAWCSNDLATAADSLVDLVYVAMGTAVMMGLPWQLLWDAVQTANMQKVRAKRAEDSTRGSQYDVIKPPGWTHPDISHLLNEYRDFMEQSHSKLGGDPMAPWIKR